MKTTKEIIKENSNKSYLWEDEKTIDIIINNKEKSFIEELIDYSCLKCGNGIILGNEKVINSFTDDVNGIKIKCNKCEQKWFIHKPINL